MTNTPSPTDSRRTNTFQRLARASWVAALFSFALVLIILFVPGGKGGAFGKLPGIVGPALILLGLAAGIIALLGMAKVGRRGILVPAVIGTVLNLALLGTTMMPSFLRPKASVLQPLVNANGQRVLKDEKLGVTLEVPEGFAYFPAGKQMQRADHVFVKGDTTDRELDVLLSVSALPAALSKERLTAAAVGGRTNVTLRTFNWRGIEVDALVVNEILLGTPFTTFNIQLPILPRAVQISVAGPTARQAELEQITAALLPTVDGKSNR